MMNKFVSKEKSSKSKNILTMDIKDIKGNLENLLKKLNKRKSSDKKRDVIAFDIGSTNIKIVCGSYFNEQLSIDKCMQIPTPANSMDDGVIKNREALITTLKSALSENNIKSKDAICTTSSNSIINREILIPLVEEDEMETVVRYEIQQYLPINLDECILQMTIINQIEDLDGKEKLNVRVIAYPKKIAWEYYQLLESLKLKPYALDVNFNSLNKFVNITNIIDKLEYNSQSSVAFLDMGSNFIDVNIYKGEKLDFTRTIKGGGKDIDEALIQEGGFTQDQLDNIKTGLVNLDVDEEEMNIETRIVKFVIDEWIEKIEMILQFYKNSNINNEINKVVIFGGVSKIKGLNKYMSFKLDVYVKNLDEVSNINFKQAEDNSETICDYMNVIGSVIRL